MHAVGYVRRRIPMMIIAGQTAHFVLSYDESLSNGNALAQAILSL